MTTDGKLSHHICSSGIEKEYYVEVDGKINDDAVQLLRNGVMIGLQGGKFKTKPCQVSILAPLLDLPIEHRMIRDQKHGSTSWLSITLTEGKYRQVRKMTAAIGFPTLRLIRIRIGKVMLDIDPGKVIEVDLIQY